MIAATASAAYATDGGAPAMTTWHGSPTVWSTWTLAPLCACSPLIVSPPLPITRPTMFFGHSTMRDSWPGPKMAVSITARPGGCDSRRETRASATATH